MLRRWGAWWTAMLHPFGMIARELSIIRELYEIDLASRNPPVRRVTEEPSRYDTEVSYAGVEEKPSARERAMEAWEAGEAE